MKREKIDLNAYINREIPCACGHTHFSGVKRIDIDRGAVKRLPGHIRDLGYKKVFIVADINTWEAAGARAAVELKAAGIEFDKVILDYEEVIPDEQVIGEIMTAYPVGYDLVLGIGSGTLNDLCKFVSHRLGIDYIIFATAPSMDGFVSIGSALMLHHVKTTLDCQGPVAVVGDTDILSAAPMKLIAAGLGDTLGKYTCLLDWKLAHLINGEYYCQEVVDMVETALETVKEQSAKVQTRDPEAVKAVTQALVLTGIAMSFVGNSRPASGCEHHFAHYWEMTALMEGRMPANHGTQVGVGMILAMKLYHRLAKEQPDFEAAMSRPFDRAAWEARMRECYGIAADGIIALENKAGKNDIAKRDKRLAVIRDNWKKIQEMIEENLPETEEMTALLKSLNAPVEPEEMDVPAQRAREAVEVAKEVRDRYTLLQLLWDLGLAAKYAETV